MDVDDWKEQYLRDMKSTLLRQGILVSSPYRNPKSLIRVCLCHVSLLSEMYEL